jgi:nucleotide-binding universal stress UspA family protein
MGDIVLGYDGSDCAKAALATATDLARAFGDRLVIVYAYEPPDRNVGEEFREHRAALHEIGERVTAEAVANSSAAGVEPEVELVSDRPLQALLRVSDDRGARLIVVGSHGEGPIKGAILGALPYKLLHASERPVLVVPLSRESRSS